MLPRKRRSLIVRYPNPNNPQASKQASTVWTGAATFTFGNHISLAHRQCAPQNRAHISRAGSTTSDPSTGARSETLAYHFRTRGPHACRFERKFKVFMLFGHRLNMCTRLGYIAALQLPGWRPGSARSKHMQPPDGPPESRSHWPKTNERSGAPACYRHMAAANGRRCVLYSCFADAWTGEIETWAQG